MEVTWSATEKFMDLKRSKKNCLTDIALQAIQTVRSFCPCIKEYGTDMFAMLDAEFACILYDGDTGEYIAARDPIGIRPLYYGYDEKV